VPLSSFFYLTANVVLARGVNNTCVYTGVYNRNTKVDVDVTMT